MQKTKGPVTPSFKTTEFGGEINLFPLLILQYFVLNEIMYSPDKKRRGSKWPRRLQRPQRAIVTNQHQFASILAVDSPAASSHQAFSTEERQL